MEQNLMLRNITDYTQTIHTSLIHKISNLVLIKGMMNAHLNNMVATMVDENNTMPSLASTVTNDTFLQESGLTNEQKKENWKKYIQMADSKKKMNMKY